MPDCTPFKIYVGENATAIVAELREQLKRWGAAVSGTDESGTFSAAIPGGGSLSGSYRTSGKSLEINITARPDALTCGTIESKMQDFILDAKAALKNR